MWLSEISRQRVGETAGVALHKSVITPVHTPEFQHITYRRTPPFWGSRTPSKQGIFGINTNPFWSSTHPTPSPLPHFYLPPHPSSLTIPPSPPLPPPSPIFYPPSPSFTIFCKGVLIYQKGWSQWKIPFFKIFQIAQALLKIRLLNIVNRQNNCISGDVFFPTEYSSAN